MGQFPSLLQVASSTLVDALPGAVVGAVVGVAVAELVRWLRQPRAEWVGFDQVTFPPGTFFGVQGVGNTGPVQVHKVTFKVRGQPSGLAAARLAWRREATFAKWDQLPEPLLNGRFEATIVPSTFFLQLTHDEEYHLPVIVEYDDGSGNRACDVFAGWWYGKGRIRSPASFSVSKTEEIEITLLGLSWQEPWKPWTRRRKRRFPVGALGGGGTAGTKLSETRRPEAS